MGCRPAAMELVWTRRIQEVSSGKKRIHWTNRSGFAFFLLRLLLLFVPNKCIVSCSSTFEIFSSHPCLSSLDYTSSLNIGLVNLTHTLEHYILYLFKSRIY